MDMKDSGKRQVFEAGAMRDSADGKPKYHLLPPCAWSALSNRYGCFVEEFLMTSDETHMRALLDALLADFGCDRLVAWLEKGAVKYESFNWAKGMPITRCLDSLGRHLRDLSAGKDDEDHAAAAMCNVSFILHYIDAMNIGLLPLKWMDLFDFDIERKKTNGN